MSQQQLDYRRPVPWERPGITGRSWAAAGVVTAATLAINAALVGAVFLSTQSAMFLALLVLPLTNLSLAIVSLCCSGIVKKLIGGASVKPYVIASLVAPFVAFVCDGMIIFPNGVPRC